MAEPGEDVAPVEGAWIETFGRNAESEDWVEPLSDLDPLTGMLPSELHHVLTRGAHPELKTQAANLIGLSHTGHRLHHQAGTDIPARRDLFDMF